MARRVRPMRARQLPAPAPHGNAALGDAVFEQQLVRTLGALPLLPPILAGSPPAGRGRYISNSRTASPAPAR